MKYLLALILILSSTSLLAKEGFFVSSTVGGHIPTLVNIPLQIGFSEGEQGIGVEYAKRDFSLDDGSVKIQNGSITNTGIFYRRHVYNSWNIYSAINKRTVSASVYVSISNPAAELLKEGYKSTLSTVQYDVYTGSAGFGNRWDLPQGWVIGVDYFIKSWILYSEARSKIYANKDEPIYGTEADAIKKDLDEFATVINSVLASSAYLMLTLGYVF